MCIGCGEGCVEKLPFGGTGSTPRRADAQSRPDRVRPGLYAHGGGLYGLLERQLPVHASGMPTVAKWIRECANADYYTFGLHVLYTVLVAYEKDRATSPYRNKRHWTQQELRCLDPQALTTLTLCALIREMEWFKRYDGYHQTRAKLLKRSCICHNASAILPVVDVYTASKKI
ncbi:uncharacterized protein LOC129593184 [Paramacrobiotus metropolitanus]|uniref:uncharacterized protein LOC129593184 n=1 Tax=Paramacrobiotus metropolitanus TaxID=2943436 RepID=UPI0024464946|nr:uncharacterized protein LOC129593184 [Paramacrobiotus metropolitanus]